MIIFVAFYENISKICVMNTLRLFDDYFTIIFVISYEYFKKKLDNPFVIFQYYFHNRIVIL